MFLAIDIGNTNIHLGVFRGSIILANWRLSTQEQRTAKGSPLALRNLFKKAKIKTKEIEGIIICSVVPKVTNILKISLESTFDIKPLIVGKDIRVPTRNLYRNPKQVGQDRLVGAFSGSYFYGAPLIIIDFGTAVTFDVISKKKEYLGGMILPGLEISLDALAERTALLPKIKLHRPYELIGRDTRSSMLSGIVYGFAALTDALVERIKEKIGKRAKVIGTGGNIQLMGKYCKSFNKLDRDLTLRGLNLIYRNFVDSVAHCHGIKENFY